MKYLVSERKCDPYVKNGLGQNCQQIALHGTGGMFSKKEETVKYLSEPWSSSARDIQRCWLHWACRCGYINLVKYFIHDLHYNPNDKEPNVEQNCFHVACTMGHTTVVEFLMSDTPRCPVCLPDQHTLFSVSRTQRSLPTVMAS